MKKVLVLGAGLVAKPLINYLLKQEEIELCVASKDFIERDYIDSHPQGETVDLDITNVDLLEQLISSNDATVSLLPYTFHIQVAKLCIKHKKDMTTASYVSDEMKALDEEAKKAGISILNELGLDPGLDHMSAMDIIDRIHEKGGKIKSFRSFCGGLPFWDATTTPFQYKFSWSPAGVLLAAKNSATFRENGKTVVIDNKELFKTKFPLDLKQFGQYEVYPNRDSIKYIDTYGLNGIDTLIRGTIRNLGWSETFDVINRLNLLDENTDYDYRSASYAVFMAQAAGVQNNERVLENVAKKMGLHPLSQVMNRLEWLGLFSDKLIGRKASRFEIMLDTISEKLCYADHEKDMILLNHEFEYEIDSESLSLESLLIAHGDDGENHIMSKTVALPLAIATRLLVEGKITRKGVEIPVHKDIYEPILRELKGFGIEFIESQYHL